MLVDQVAGSFTERDAALIIWLTVLTLSVLYFRPARQQLKALLRQFLQPAILLSFTLMFAYIILLVAVLWKIGLWDATLAKDTVVWSTGFAIYSMFRLPSLSAEPSRFKPFVRETISGAIFMEFYMNLFVMSLWIELLLIPTVTLLVLLILVGEKDKKAAAVVSILRGIQACIGFSLFAFVTHSLLVGFADVVWPDVLKSLLLAPLLSVLYLPFLYAAALYMAYESLFIRMRFSIRDPEVRRYAKRRTLGACHLLLSRLAVWSKRVLLTRPANTAAIDAALQEFRSV